MCLPLTPEVAQKIWISLPDPRVTYTRKSATGRKTIKGPVEGIAACGPLVWKLGATGWGSGSERGRGMK